MSTTFTMPAELQEKYDALKAQMKALKEQMSAASKQFFSDASKAIFDAFPDLKSFGWRQYTPYFNDGDPCNFRVCTSDIYLSYAGNTQTEDEDEEESFSTRNIREWKGSNFVPKTDLTPREQAGKACLDLLNNFDDQFFEEAFGDHVRVTVSRNGVETDEYEHD